VLETRKANVNGSSSIWQRSYWGSDRIAYDTNSGSGPFFYAYDAHGDTIHTTDTAAPDNYDPYGNPTGTNAATYLSYGFRGELTVNGQIHLRAREYAPSSGMFTQRDALDGTTGTSVATDPYHYADNDPINRVDPTGYSPAPTNDSQTNDDGTGQDGKPVTTIGPDGNPIDRQLQTMLARLVKMANTTVRTVAALGRSAAAGGQQASPVSVGVCGAGAATAGALLGFSGEESVCMIIGPHDYWFTESTGGPFGLVLPGAKEPLSAGIGGGFTVGDIVTNAMDSSQVEDWSLCVGGTIAGEIVAGSGEVCFNTNWNPFLTKPENSSNKTQGLFTGKFTLYLGIGVGVGVEAHALPAWEEVLFTPPRVEIFGVDPVCVAVAVPFCPNHVR
jgi:RHS repeat-associated protein